MNDLEKCHRNAKTLQALCNAANSGGNRSFCPNSEQLTSAMDLCFKKFDYVVLCSKKLEVMVKYCSRISKGI